MKGLETSLQPTTPEVFSGEHLALIAAAYGLSGLRFVRKPDAGIITKNAILEDEEGKHYFVKLYNTEDADKYASIYRAAELVAENTDIPVSLPYKTAGNSFAAVIDGKSLAMFDCIEHSETPPPDEQAEIKLSANLGKVLGQIHTIPVPTNDELLKPVERWLPDRIEKQKRTLVKIIDIIQKKSQRDDFDTLALEVAAEKLELLDKLKPKPKPTPLGAGTLSICHGDFNAYNVLHNDDMEVVAVCDWDNAGLSNHYIDFLNTFTALVIGRLFGTYQTERFEIALAFVASYVDAAGQDIDEKQLEEAYHTFMCERISVAWPMNQHYLQGNTDQDDRLAQPLPRPSGAGLLGGRVWETLGFPDTL